MYREETKHYSGGMQMSAGTSGFSSAQGVGVPMAAAAAGMRSSDYGGYELESRPSYRPYRPDSVTVEMDGPMSPRKHGEYVRLRE